MPAPEDSYLVQCFQKHLVPPSLDREKENRLLAQIEANFNVLLRPWLSTCDFPREEISFLEIGCGDGKYGYFIAPNVARYVGVDIRDAAIDRARLLLAPLGNCEVIRGNGLSLKEIPNNSQTLVFSYQTFIHMPDREVILSNLREVVRVLAGEGEARIQLLGPAYQEGFRVVWRKLGSLDTDDRRGWVGMLLRGLGRLLPGDFLMPKIRRAKYPNHWGQFGAWIHPGDAKKVARALGANAWVTPSSYGSRHDGYDYAIYWLVITKGRRGLPFFLTLD